MAMSKGVTETHNSTIQISLNTSSHIYTHIPTRHRPGISGCELHAAAVQRALRRRTNTWRCKGLC